MCDSLDAVYEENDLSSIEIDEKIRQLFARKSIIEDKHEINRLALKSLTDSSETSRLSTVDDVSEKKEKK
jgi:hypothetical protein